MISHPHNHTVNIVLLVTLLTTYATMLIAQQTTSRPERTPEQEAAKQTESLQRIITDLTPEQIEQIKAINLKYAIERQQSTNRTQAIDRIQRKNEEYRQVLTPEQYALFQKSRKICSDHSTQAQGIKVDIRIKNDKSTSRPVRNDF